LATLTSVSNTTLRKSEVTVHHSRRRTLLRASNLLRATVTSPKKRRVVTASMGIFSLKMIFISSIQTLAILERSNRNRISRNKKISGMQTLIFTEHTLPTRPERTLPRSSNNSHKVVVIRTAPNTKTISQSRSDHHHHHSSSITRTGSQIAGKDNRDSIFSQKRSGSTSTRTLKIIRIFRRHSKMHKRTSGATFKKTATGLKLMKNAGMSVHKSSVNTRRRKTQISTQTTASTRRRPISDGAHTSQASTSRFLR
jgi:hypothetical protein